MRLREVRPTVREPAAARRWRVARPPAGAVTTLSSELGISRILATVLANRGLVRTADARAFLERRPGAPDDPFLLEGMDRAVTRLLSALQSGERICVYGDYDVDGLTAAAVLVTVLREAGASVTWYIPSRTAEGYGLNAEALRRIRAGGSDLVVTVDCGTTAVAEAALARSLGLGLIITDHHTPGPVLPAADALVNPRRAGSGYPFEDLAGVGVAYKLSQALTAFLGRADGDRLWRGLEDLVALGTVCDVVPLTGENRFLVWRGLELFSPPARVGLAALGEVAGLDGAEATTRHLAFAYGPRLNAAGRLGDAERALRLLLTQDEDEARRLAVELDHGNRERQALEAAILEEVVERVVREVDLETERAIVLAGRGWHEGVIGIVASRVVERFARPALLVAINDGVGRGSGRSVPGFDLVSALADCAGHLLRYGGHRMAAGFEIGEDAFEGFCRDFLALARERLGDDDLERELSVDAVVEPGLLAASVEEFARELALLEPHGTGNPEPVLAVGGARFLSVRPVGSGGRHLRARVAVGGRVFGAVGFGLGGRAADLRAVGGPVHIAFRPAWDEWQGERRVELRLLDVSVEGPGP